MYGEVLDVPGSELDNQQENVGSEGENNFIICVEIIKTI